MVMTELAMANLTLEQFSQFEAQSGVITGAPTPTVARHLSDLQGVFADEAAYTAALAQGNPLIYTVTNIEPAQGEGALHYALGMLRPGRVGQEYYLTKGHFHAWRPAAEVYLGLQGEGVLLLEDETGRESKLLPLLPNSIVYVPGFTAHRTINTGEIPLTYLGIYPANAGHDYQAIAQRNFQKVVVALTDKPTLLDRATFRSTLMPDK